MLDATPEARRATCNRLAEIFIAGLKATGDSLSNITADLAEDTEQARIDRTALDLLKDIDV